MAKKVVKKATKKKHTHKVAKKTSHTAHKKSGSPPRKTTKVKKRAAKVKRIPTGIKGFDKLVQGGFEYGSINLVAGGNGSGKTVFAMQFLIEGIKQGEPCLYIAFEESRKEFFADMATFGWDLEKAEKAGKFIFLEYNPEKVRMMLDEGGGAIESVIYRSKIKRLVIDSISSFTLLFEDEASKRQSVLSLFDIIRKWDLTTLLTLQKNPLRNKDDISAEELQADSAINMYYVKIKNKRERLIEILKMRGTNHSKDTHKFDITKKGLAIGQRSKINLSKATET